MALPPGFHGPLVGEVEGVLHDPVRLLALAADALDVAQRHRVERELLVGLPLYLQIALHVVRDAVDHEVLDRHCHSAFFGSGGTVTPTFPASRSNGSAG